jgi:hypothetical protein
LLPAPSGAVPFFAIEDSSIYMSICVSMAQGAPNRAVVAA